MIQVTVVELQKQLTAHLTSITSQAQANRCLQRIRQLTDKNLNDLRCKYRDETNQLICDLCDLLNSPIHKSQSRIRHASEDVRFLLFDRFTIAISFLNELPSPKAILPEFDTTEQVLKYFLIDLFDHKMEAIFPSDPQTPEA